MRIKVFKRILLLSIIKTVLFFPGIVRAMIMPGPEDVAYWPSTLQSITLVIIFLGLATAGFILLTFAALILIMVLSYMRKSGLRWFCLVFHSRWMRIWLTIVIAIFLISCLAFLFISFLR